MLIDHSCRNNNSECSLTNWTHDLKLLPDVELCAEHEAPLGGSLDVRALALDCGVGCIRLVILIGDLLRNNRLRASLYI